MRGKWAVVSAAVILAGVSGGALSLLRRPAAPKPALAAKPPEVRSQPADLILPGKIQAQHVISVGPQAAGRIAEFFAEVGQPVYEGQVLARIANPGFDAAREMAAAAVESAQSRVTSLERAIIAARLEASRARADASRARDEFDRTDKVYRRQQMLNREGATPRLVFEKAQSEFESAQSQHNSLEDLARQSEERVATLTQDLQAAKRTLDDRNKQSEDAQHNLAAMEIHSPSGGMLISRNGEMGEQVSPQNEDLFQIATDLAALEVVAQPRNSDLSRIKPGSPALVTVPDLPGESLAATMKEVKADQVVLAFASPNPALKPGMTAQVRIRLE